MVGVIIAVNDPYVYNFVEDAFLKEELDNTTATTSVFIVDDLGTLGHTDLEDNVVFILANDEGDGEIEPEPQGKIARLAERLGADAIICTPCDPYRLITTVYRVAGVARALR